MAGQEIRMGIGVAAGATRPTQEEAAEDNGAEGHACTAGHPILGQGHDYHHE